MLHGTYIGTNPTLKHEKALLRVDKQHPDNFLAQFDNFRLGGLALNWHEYLASDWKLDEVSSVGDYITPGRPKSRGLNTQNS